MSRTKRETKSPKHREIIVLLGKPGSGKGTQAEPLGRALGLPVIPVGKLLRAEIAKKSPLGKRAARDVAAGRLVPNDVTAAILRKRLSRSDAKLGVIIDGCPRDLLQAGLLEEIAHVTHAFLISVTDREVMRRLSGRRVCTGCGKNYHMVALRPRVAGICDACGGKLARRPDDSIAVIRERLRSYERDTIPVLQFYRAHKVLRRVDGVGGIPEVQRRMRAMIRRDDRKGRI